MTPAGSIALQLALSVAMVILTAYVSGRVHQWYRHGFDRDVAYREGYNQASHTLFQLAVRSHPAGSTTAAGGLPGAPQTAVPGPAPAQVRAVVPLHHLSDRTTPGDHIAPGDRTAYDIHAERRETARLLHHQV
ncbi:hypothetical protein [Couchioplanes azureus]|uniref:hypothetical protein n=1 Tax=Couchioplanes caeruleus TaxID=56438 RepID=UPI001670BC21|nr:hypothetical protein [Couchioplanes caeruleus]GGQ40476.1 hypothetical protein GCM10010166_04470 [Couchioplanes caeruleus subsp. azureus]